MKDGVLRNPAHCDADLCVNVGMSRSMCKVYSSSTFLTMGFGVLLWSAG